MKKDLTQIKKIGMKRVYKFVGKRIKQSIEYVPIETIHEYYLEQIAGFTLEELCPIESSIFYCCFLFCAYNLINLRLSFQERRRLLVVAIYGEGKFEAKLNRKYESFVK